MRSLAHVDGLTAIALSRSNLLALLAALDGHPNSAATISRRSENGVTVAVTAEEDEVHYSKDGRDGVRGLMDEGTETAMMEARAS